MYIFFKQTPSIEYIKDRRVHVFECAAKHCMGKVNGRMVRRYLDTGDAKSTSNLCKHAKICWGEEAVAAAAAHIVKYSINKGKTDVLLPLS